MKHPVRLVALLFVPAPQPAMADPTKAALYRDPQCGCCEGYAAYLRDHGFEVDVKPTHDLAEISRRAGVPAQFQGCHTMQVDGYVWMVMCR